MPPLKTKDVISRFKSSFGEEIQIISTVIHKDIINKFVVSLRKVINNLGTLSQRALCLAEAYDNYSQKMGRFGNIQKTYETILLSQYTDSNQQKSIIFKDSENRISKLKDLSRLNPFYKLYSFLNNQTRDAEAFLRVIIASELFILRKDEL